MQRTKRRSAKAWREVVARFAQSGMMEEAFCQREGLGAKLCHRWRTKRSSSAVRPVADKPARNAPSREATGEFVDVGSLKDGGSKLETRLDLGGGMLL